MLLMFLIVHLWDIACIVLIVKHVIHSTLEFVLYHTQYNILPRCFRANYYQFIGNTIPNIWDLLYRHNMLTNSHGVIS